MFVNCHENNAKEMLACDGLE